MSSDPEAPVAARMRALGSIIDGLATPEPTPAQARSLLAAAQPSDEPDRITLPPPEQESAALPEAPVARDVVAEEPAPPALTPVDRPPGREIELKLLADPDLLAGFNDAPIIAANARSKGTSRHLKAVYYDTPKRALRRAGLSLRVRQIGNRFVQTVKSEFGDDPLQRGEWEATVPSLNPDVALALPFVPDKLRADLERSLLQPVFTADIRRRQRTVCLTSGTVEVSFDHGTLVAGDRSLPVSEIELELKDGSAQTIYDLALRLAGARAAQALDQKQGRARLRPRRPTWPPTAPKPREARSRSRRPA